MKVHTLFTLVANTHIVETGKGIVIVDAGMPHTTWQIMRKIRALGYALRDVRLILVTHGHIDHAGSAAALKRVTGAPIALHRGDERLIATRDLKIPPGRTPRFDTVGRWMVAMGWVVPLDLFTPDVWLADGQSLCEFGFDARVVHTPGHTAGSISVLCENGALFVGDAILNLVRVSFPLYWEDPLTAFDSAVQLHALKPRVCYSGHGRAFDAAEFDPFIEKIKIKGKQAYGVIR